MTSPAGTSKSPAEVVRAVMDAVGRLATTGDRAAAEGMADLYADPTHVLHPMSPEIPALVTRDDLRHHMERLLDGRPPADSHRAVDVVIRPTDDPELVVTEFHYETVIDGTTLTTPCIWVTRVRDGQIVEARDYNGTPTPA